MIEISGENRIYLYPGEFVTSADPCRITTILGSCVSVCLWDETRGFGGMTHFVLPLDVRNGVSSPRFGNVAIRLVIAALRELGSDPRELEAKLFGGSAMQGARVGSVSLGEQNVLTARHALAREGIPVVAEDVGGVAGRKILFDTADGSVWVKTLEAGR